MQENRILNKPKVSVCGSTHLYDIQICDQQDVKLAIIFDWPGRISQGSCWYHIVFNVQLFDLSVVQITQSDERFVNMKRIHEP